MNGVTRETWVAVICTFNPTLALLLVAVAALVALSLLALFPRQRTWKGMLAVFVVYWMGLFVVLLMFVQAFMGRTIVQLEFVPYEAEYFGSLLRPMLFGLL